MTCSTCEHWQGHAEAITLKFKQKIALRNRKLLELRKEIKRLQQTSDKTGCKET